jgi:hypothetical protein
MVLTWLDMELGMLQIGVKVKVSTLDLHEPENGGYKV